MNESLIKMFVVYNGERKEHMYAARMGVLAKWNLLNDASVDFLHVKLIFQVITCI